MWCKFHDRCFGWPHPNNTKTLWSQSIVNKIFLSTLEPRKRTNKQEEKGQTQCSRSDSLQEWFGFWLFFSVVQTMYPIHGTSFSSHLTTSLLCFALFLHHPDAHQSVLCIFNAFKSFNDPFAHLAFDVCMCSYTLYMLVSGIRTICKKIRSQTHLLVYGRKPKSTKDHDE